MASLLLLSAIILIWGYYSSNLILKNESPKIESTPGSFGRAYEPFSILNDEGTPLSGWFVPAKTPSPSLIIFLHGWGANKSDVIVPTIFLADRYNLAYFDFRNHGESGRSRTSLTCLEVRDLKTVVRALRAQKKEFAKNLGLYGFSMGAAAAITGAADLPEVQAVIAESPFSSYNHTVVRFARLFYKVPKFATRITLWSMRLRLGFNPEDCSPIYHVHKIAPRPILIFQGGQDKRMPIEEGQQLYAKAQEPKELLVIPEADHGDIKKTDPEEYEKRVLAFYDQWLTNKK